MIKLLSLVFFSFIAILSWSQMQETEIFVTDENQDTLYGTICSPQPQLDTTQAIVLIIAGSGPTDRNGNNSVMVNNSLQMLAHDLSKFGIASIRYDKRGVAASAGAFIPEEELTFSDNVLDAELFYQFAEDLGYSKIAIAGHSEGSLIGILLAQRHTPNGFISLAGAGRPIQDVLKEQYEVTAPIVRDSAHVIIDLLAAGKRVDTLSPWLYSVFRPSIQPYIISWMQLNPSEQLGLVKCPSIVIQGDLDMQVSVEDAQFLGKNLPEDNLFILKEMNHVLKKVEPTKSANKAAYNDPALPLHPDLIFTIVSFIKTLE